MALSVGCEGEEAHSPSSPEAADLRVVQVWDHTAVYVEGARSCIAVETGAGNELVELELGETARGYEGTVRLDPGQYRLLSWQRPSSGAGEIYDPPTDRCSAPFSVMPSTAVRARIEVRAGEGCTIEFQ